MVWFGLVLNLFSSTMFSLVALKISSQDYNVKDSLMFLIVGVLLITMRPYCRYYSIWYFFGKKG